MPRGRRSHGTLASLERQLADLNLRRDEIISRIRSAVEGLSAGVHRAADSGYSAIVGYARRGRRAAGAARKRTMSAQGRKRLSLAAKRRWAEAKKAGKTRLG
jgi:hypothetical protein